MYAIKHNGRAYGPGGIIKDTKGTPLDATDIDAYNKALAEKEMGYYRTGPDHIFAYVRHGGWLDERSHSGTITNWLGDKLGDAWIGSEYTDNFGGKRAAVTTRIFGTLYHGTYFSNYDYCRLKRAKHQ